MEIEAMTVKQSFVLPQDLLERCRARAPKYDQENRFFQEDFDELRAAGYLRMSVPREFDGAGLNLAEVMRETRRLARYAPANALALNMHHYWVGTAADLWRKGDKSVEWILRDAAAGEVFASGHSESGNETSVLSSITKAERVEGGYRFTGRKSFGSLSPVWTRLGIHGEDRSDPAAPKVVHAFLSRDAEGYAIKQTWDVLGMRATRSDDTLLERAFVPDKHIVRVVAPGLKGSDPLINALFAWSLLGFGNVYFGLAQRVLELAVDLVKRRRSARLTRSMAYHPSAQYEIAEMVMELEAIGPQLDTVAREWSEGVDHRENWATKIVAAKYRAVEGAWRVVDRALEVSGGAGMFKNTELERLFRDARAGRFHPCNSALAHEIIGKLALGVDFDDELRWG
jgi:alkylation response protein AidB-like acyl-CoA dehydrogenase